jgi:predicted ATPase
MPELPSGTVTFLFTDVEGSTRLLHESGPLIYTDELAAHRRALRDAFTRHHGVEVDTQGDAFFVAFSDAADAMAAAGEAQRGLAQGRIRVRMGLHTGEPHLTDEGYVGSDVHLGARIAAAGHGGQVLMSRATRDRIAESSAVLDLGEHRLKDFTEPVWIYQLGTDHFPPLRTISNTNLPRPASSFVGRERELAEVTALMQDGARLLTLTGPGGSGKTRLAIEAAATLVQSFKAGVFWVGLASLREPALVTETIAQTIGARDGVAAYIGEREMLLIVDNLEQVIDAAPDLASLVEACPNLRVLVTSRERLRVRGEVEYAVPPLAEREAIQLFTARSQFASDGTIAELCRRLDDLPLAVELAAARTGVLSPAQILERLSTRLDILKGGRDADARQQTLRATIAWSHDLLSEAERALFARLSVFAGGFTLEAAEAVADAELDELESLADKSLLRHAEDRFWMLETIRAFAAERLDSSDQATWISERHAEHFRALAEAAEPHLFGRPESSKWLDRVGLDYDNIRAAIDRLEKLNRIDSALSVVGSIWVFWRDRAYYAEGRRRIDRLLDADSRPTAARAKALTAAAAMASLGGDAAAGLARAKEALEAYHELGEAKGIAESELWLGWALAQEDDWAEALPHFTQSLELLTGFADPGSIVLATMMLAMAHAELGHRERARMLDEENLRRARELGRESEEASTLGNLAGHALHDGRVAEGLTLAAQGLRIYHGLHDPHGVAIELRRCAWAYAMTRQPVTATQLIAAAEELQQQIGGTMPWVRRIQEQAIAVISTQLDQTGFRQAWEQGRKLTADEAVALALSGVDGDA